MGRLLGSLFGLHREERTMALLMAAYHVLLLVTLYLLKPVRDSLFLSSRGPDELPFVFILTTLAIVPVAVLHTRASNRLRVGQLVDGGSVLLVFSILGMRGLMALGGEWVSYALYAWVSIYGLLVTSQFWLLANALFTSAQAKRIFTALSAGAILGAIVGGQLTSMLVDNFEMQSENLLWVAAGVLGGATVLAFWIRQRYQEEQSSAPEAPAKQQEEDAAGALSTIRDSRHIQLIVGIIALTVIVTTLVDYQFKTVASRAYPSEAGLTSFMGQFYGWVSVAALIVQTIVAPRLMRIVGIGGALSMLPAMLAMGAVGMLVVPGLAAGVFMRGSEQSLKHSIDKTGRELLFVPVPMEKKKRVKVFIDLFVDQSGQGLGGVLLLVVVTGLGLSVQMLSLVVLALIALWGLLAYRARHSYVQQFRARLREQEARVERAEEEDDEPAEVDLDDLIDSLCSHTETNALSALEQLEEGSMPVPVEALLCLLDHPAAAVREHALRVFRVREVEGVANAVAETLRDPDPDVQVEAARYLYCQQTDSHVERLRQGLTHDDPKVQSATVGLIAEEGDPTEYELVDESLLRRLVALDGADRADTRVQVARILGVLDRPYRNELLRRLLHDEETRVVQAALKAAGQTNDRSFVRPLVEALGKDALERPAQQALASFNPPVLGTLYDSLVDGKELIRVRQRIPAVFAERPHQLAVTLLVQSLSSVPIPVRHSVSRALSKLHRAGDFTCDPDALDAAIEREVEHHAVLGQLLRFARRSGGGIDALSAATLKALREEALERIFRLLGLRYDQRDLYDAYLGLVSEAPELQDSAIEFVDNLVDYETRRILLPLLDDPAGERAMEIGKQFFDRSIQHEEEARRYLREVEDPRLAPGAAEVDADLVSEGRDGENGSLLSLTSPQAE